MQKYLPLRARWGKRGQRGGFFRLCETRVFFLLLLIVFLIFLLRGRVWGGRQRRR